MVSTKKILIIEDDKELSFSYESMFRIAIHSLLGEGISISPQVFKAPSFEEALSILETHEIDLMSVDLALKEQDKDLKESDRREGRDPGGMRILKYLQTKKQKPITIIMSGETLMSYATDAFQKYGVFAYFQKSKDEENLGSAFAAALWYLEAKNTLLTVEIDAEYEFIGLFEKYWINAKEKAHNANISPKNFPSDFDLILPSIKSKFDSPTKLPGNDWTEKVLRDRILHGIDWSLIKFQIDDYSSFVTSQASQVDPLLGYVGAMVKSQCKESDLLDVYVGIWRHDYPSGPCVIVILNLDSLLLKNIADATVANVKEKAKFFLHAFEDSLTQPNIKYQIWNSGNNSEMFIDWHQIVDKLGKDIN